MAGGGESLGGGPKQKRGKAGKRKVKKRVGFRLDMTPLVDITFLLLTFFMLTTSMITPQTMEMKIPPQLEEIIEVKESELLTIRIREDGKLFFNMGNDAPQSVKITDLRKVVVEQNVALRNRCIVVMKASGETMYGAAVAVLDMLNGAEPDISEKLRQAGINKRERKFTVAPYEKKDAEEVLGL